MDHDSGTIRITTNSFVKKIIPTEHSNKQVLRKQHDLRLPTEVAVNFLFLLGLWRWGELAAQGEWVKRAEAAPRFELFEVRKWQKHVLKTKFWNMPHCFVLFWQNDSLTVRFIDVIRSLHWYQPWSLQTRTCNSLLFTEGFKLTTGLNRSSWPSLRALVASDLLVFGSAQLSQLSSKGWLADASAVACADGLGATQVRETSVNDSFFLYPRLEVKGRIQVIVQYQKTCNRFLYPMIWSLCYILCKNSLYLCTG